MTIFQERILFILSAIGVLLFIASFLVIVFQVGGFATPVVLHFDSVKGIDLYGGVGDVWVIWITSLVLFLCNILFANIFYFRERFLSYTFIVFNVFWAILTLIFAGVITSAN